MEANKILSRMLERLFAGLVSGPNLNCRPHSSRQRIDFAQLGKLKDRAAEELLALLLTEGEVKVAARAPAPKRPKKVVKDGQQQPNGEETLTPEEKAVQEDWAQQQAVLGKLRILAEEARTYRQDTGVHVLNVGLPLLSLPAGSLGRSGSKRVLAPIAFVPVEVTLRSGTQPSVHIVCQKDGEDVVLPNLALFAWLEQQTGQAVDESILDEVGPDRWEQIRNLVRHAAQMLKLTTPAFLDKAEEKGAGSKVRAWDLKPAPRSDDDAKPAIVPAAVLGLFPMHNQGLLRDTKTMLEEPVAGPIESFLRADVSLDEAPDFSYEHESWSGRKRPRAFAEERLVTVADPCQARAVRLARDCRGLVIHGPPGTGKSQTITNIVGDHLARGQRVLMVCDKRTALDVVANRLEHLGLGSLFAVIHDPRHDQRDLYRKLRDQLEVLTDARTDSWAQKKLSRADEELQRVHDDLTQYWQLLLGKDGGGTSLHELVGDWLETAAPNGLEIDGLAPSGANLREFEQHGPEVRDVLERAAKADLAHNPWRHAAGISLEAFLARPMKQVRAALEQSLPCARNADELADPAIPPFSAGVSLAEQSQARAKLAVQIEDVMKCLDRAGLARWVAEDQAAVRRASGKLAQVEPLFAEVHSTPLDAELALAAGKLAPAQAARHLGTLEAYLEIADCWYAWLFLRRRSEAARVLRDFGLPPNAESARRLRAFLKGRRTRQVLQDLLRELAGAKDPKQSDDEGLLKTVGGYRGLLDMLEQLHTAGALAGLSPMVKKSLLGEAPTLLAGLQHSSKRAEALAALVEALTGSGLLAGSWLDKSKERWYAGAAAGGDVQALVDRLETIESILRMRHGLEHMPAWLRTCVENLLTRGLAAEPALAACRKAVLAAEIADRLRKDKRSQSFDPHRLKGHLQRYRELEQEKQALVRDTILHHWISRQRERLLVGTGSRLNSQGADLRRRLTMRGEQALRLRQVIAVGQKIDGGDPLFDLCPVWLASPETVAQVFPRQPLFDLVIFDEASQCRLEEALPVLTRAGRVVIAGDPKQLPPSRFFESTLAASAEEDVDSDQDLFEAHQSEIEDLLGAALSIDIQQCYLDVHYRSRNADLIEFSNQQFYSRRLQAIPGHPANRVRFPPITLYAVGGTYVERTNETEAERVGQIVRDLLRRAEPPSIGIACFNLSQRDLILEKLDELAEEDREFANRLVEARSRTGPASFEGLFVKNLENVQGDERDHIIISTTYGPDGQGRFYRRFGPLGRAGGGRRLNVLVTRARHEVHLVTSIPANVYRGLPPIPEGQTPGGGWLLFSYLAYAEQMAEAYEAAHHEIADTQGPRPAGVHLGPSASPSRFAIALANQLARDKAIGSTVHWGNEGFCVDIALHHPRRAEDVTLGILCDGARFAQAEDPVEWDIFRTAILESQGWRLHRLWTPHFFRDPEGHTAGLLREVKDFLKTEERTEAVSGR